MFYFSRTLRKKRSLGKITSETTKIKIRESCSILPEQRGKKTGETIDQQSCKNYEVSYPKGGKESQQWDTRLSDNNLSWKQNEMRRHKEALNNVRSIKWEDSKAKRLFFCWQTAELTMKFMNEDKNHWKCFLVWGSSSNELVQKLIENLHIYL